LNPKDALIGLEEFSHVIITFVFHLNNNEHFSAKVSPPRLNGEKRGVFGTRSPHRPNPLGYTVARLLSIEGATITFSAVDLCDETPVLDIKPYIPKYDSIPDASVPAWVEDCTVLRSMGFTSSAWDGLVECHGKQNLFESVESLATSIEQALSLDPRAWHTRVGLSNCTVEFAGLLVSFEINENVYTIVGVSLQM